MQGLYAVLGFPVITFASYGSLILWFHLQKSPRIAQYANLAQTVLYPLLLLIPLAVIFLENRKDFLQWSGIAGGTVITASNRAMGIAAAILTGGILFLFEGFCLARFRSKNRRETRQQADTSPIAPLALPLQIPLIILVVLLEEMLWRGYLIRALFTYFPVGVSTSILVSGAAFGMNHYYGGFRQVLMKTILGVVWGGLFLWGGSITLPVLSHLTFDGLVAGSLWLEQMRLPLQAESTNESLLRRL